MHPLQGRRARPNNRGYVGPRSKNRGFIEALEVRQIYRGCIEAVEDMSGLDQKIEGVYRGSQGYVGPRSKNQGFIEALEVRQIHRVLIQSLHTFHKGYRISSRLNGSVVSHQHRIYSPIAYLYTIITSDKKRDSSCGKRHHLFTIYIPIYIRSPCHS
jgi:hypothetical protein